MAGSGSTQQLPRRRAEEAQPTRGRALLGALATCPHRAAAAAAAAAAGRMRSAQRCRRERSRAGPAGRARASSWCAEVGNARRDGDPGAAHDDDVLAVLRCDVLCDALQIKTREQRRLAGCLIAQPIAAREEHRSRLPHLLLPLLFLLLAQALEVVRIIGALLALLALLVRLWDVAIVLALRLLYALERSGEVVHLLNVADVLFAVAQLGRHAPARGRVVHEREVGTGCKSDSQSYLHDIGIQCSVFDNFLNKQTRNS